MTETKTQNYRIVKSASGEYDLYFDKAPRVKNKADAVELLDVMIKADGVFGKEDLALKAIRNYIQKFIGGR
jgi:LAS superfamily LD-carboxypeptidase LdcB